MDETQVQPSTTDTTTTPVVAPEEIVATPTESVEETSVPTETPSTEEVVA